MKTREKKNRDNFDFDKVFRYAWGWDDWEIALFSEQIELETNKNVSDFLEQVSQDAEQTGGSSEAFEIGMLNRNFESHL